MAPHSSTLAWRIPWTEEPGGLQSMGSLESDTTERLHFHFSLSCIGEGNGNPLQCSCLENPREGEAWWATVYGVAQSWTQLKGFSNIYIQCNKFLSMHFMHLTISMCVSECVILAASVWGLSSSPSVITSLIPWVYDFFNCILWPRTWSLLVTIPCKLEKNVHFAVVRLFRKCLLDPVDWWCCSCQPCPFWFSACWLCQLLTEGCRNRQLW